MVDRGKRVEDDFLTADESAAQMMRAELALARCTESFQRWLTELHHMIGNRALAYNDIWVLHATRLVNGNPDVGALSMFLNRFDVANIQYSLKKLEQLGLVERVTDKETRKTRYSPTDEGIQASDRFAKFRRHILIDRCLRQENFVEQAVDVARYLDQLRSEIDRATQLVVDRNVLLDDQVKV